MSSGKRPAILVTYPIFPEAVDRLRTIGDVSVPEERRNLTRKELMERIQAKHALLSLVTDRVDAEVMDAAGGSLRVIGNCAVGYDNIDLKAATQRGIQVSNTPGVLTEATADLAWALMLSVARRVVVGDRHVRKGAFHGWGIMDFLGQDLQGTTLGILGMGRIGQAVARRAMGFRMRVLYTTRSERTFSLWGKDGVPPDFDFSPHRVPLETLLQESDFLSIHVPSGASTHHIIGWEELVKMKPTAFLINTARGNIVEEDALVKALKEKQIAGAGLDVYEKEPALAQGLTDLDNVVLLPHIGSATHATRRRMAMTAVDNILAGLQGERVPNLVNTDVRVKD